MHTGLNLQNQRIGKDLFDDSLDCAREVDITLADEFGHGWIDLEDIYIGVMEGTDFDLYAQNIREGVSYQSEMKSGPTQGPGSLHEAMLCLWGKV